jgi:hypothetical protein
VDLSLLLLALAIVIMPAKWIERVPLPNPLKEFIKWVAIGFLAREVAAFVVSFIASFGEGSRWYQISPRTQNALMSWVWIAMIGSLIAYSEHRRRRLRAAPLEQTGTKQKARWWREVLTAFAVALVVAFIVSAYYNAKLSQARRRAEQAEARLKQIEQQRQVSSVPPGNKVNDAPTNLVCPEGTTLRYRRVIDLTKDGNAETGEWQCIGKPQKLIIPRKTPPQH